MKKVIVFDWSGTLLDSFSEFLDVCKLMFEKLGGEMPSDDKIKSTFTSPYMKFWNHYFPDLKKEEQDRLYEKFIHQVGEPDIFDTVKETLLELKVRGYILFIVSSDPKKKLLSQIERSNLTSLFEQVHGTVHDKTRTLKEIIQQYGLTTKENYYVGDTDGDILMGKAAGFKTIGITWGFQDKKRLQSSKPDYLISSISEITQIISTP